MPQKFSELDIGWATKYYWFSVVEEIDPSTPPFEDMIKTKRFTFTKQSGTIAADIHSSTMAIDFYSQKFVDFLKKAGIRNFRAYKLKFTPELSHIGNYHYLEPTTALPAKKVKTKLMDKSVFYLKDWRGQDFFTIKGTRRHIVTERLKILIEHEKFKNVKFKEIVPA